MSVYAASVDTGDNAAEVANDISFPLGEGVTEDVAQQLGAWWNSDRNIIQPSQFLIRQDGTIIQSTYSDGPLGRMLAGDVCGLVNYLRNN